MLTFAGDATDPIEVALDGHIGALVLPPGAILLSREDADGGTIVVIEAGAPEITLRIGPTAR